MDRTDPRIQTAAKCCTGFFLFLRIAGVIIVAVIAFRHTDSDCDKPLDAWLITLGVCLLVSFICDLAAELTPFVCPDYFSYEAIGDGGEVRFQPRSDAPCFVTAYTTLLNLQRFCLGLFIIVWYIIGLVWYEQTETTDTCPEELRVFVLVWSIIFFATIGFAFLMICLACCIFGVALGVLGGAALGQQQGFAQQAPTTTYG